MKIQQIKEKFEINEEHFWIPGVVLISNCPDCNQEISVDLDDQFICKPKINSKNAIPFFHDYKNENGNWETHEWQEEVLLELEVKNV